MFRAAINEPNTSLVHGTPAPHSTKPRITPPPETMEDKYNENWNRHIDNQAYLEQRRRLRAAHAKAALPVTIIERPTIGKYRYSDDSGVDRSQRPKNHHYLYPHREQRHLKESKSPLDLGEPMISQRLNWDSCNSHMPTKSHLILSSRLQLQTDIETLRLPGRT